MKSVTFLESTDTKRRPVRAIHLVCSLALGMGLALLCVVAPRPPAAAALPDEPGEAAQVVLAGAPAPPRVEQTPPDVASPPSRSASFVGRPTAGGAPGFALAAAAPVRAPDRAALSPLAPPMPGDADLAVCMTTDRVWGLVGAGETVTVTVNGAQMGAAQANDIGFFWTTLYDPNGNRPGLDDGDVVRIYHDGAQAANVTLRAITATVDVVSDVASGAIGGVSSPISVTVYAPSGEPSMASYSQTVSTDGAGNFSADFAGVCDIVPWDEAAVAYVENGVEVHRHVYSTRFMALPSPLNLVFGWTTPGGVVTATVYSDATTIRDQVVGTAGTRGGYGIGVTILTTDTFVVVELADGTVLSRTVDILTENIDPANDRITGLTSPGTIVHGLVDNLTPVGWRSVQTAAVADATGVYTLDFAGLADFMPGQWCGVHVADGEGDDLAVWEPSPSVEVNQTYNQVYGYDDAPFGPIEGRVVTLTFYSAISDTTSFYTTTMPGVWSQYGFDQKNDLPDIAPGDVVTVESEGFGWQGVVQVMTMTVEADPDANQFAGAVVSPTERVELSGSFANGQLYPAGGQFAMLITATGPGVPNTFTVSPPGFDVKGDLSYEVAHRTVGDYVERVSRSTDMIGEVMNHNGVGVVFNPPGVAYTVTLYNSGGSVKVQVTGNSGEPTGWQWINLWDYGQEQIEVGDYLRGQSAAGFSHTVQIPAIAIVPDSATNVVSGQGPANELLLMTVDNQGRGYVPSDGSGQFTFAVDQLQEMWGNGDLEWGDNVWVNYYDANNTWLVNGFQWPQIVARYEMGDQNMVFGYNAIPGNTIYITVTDPVANVVATGTTTIGTCDWCDYRLDFPAGTIIPDNTVTVDFGDGLVDSMTVVTITAEVDPDSDVVTVTAPVGVYISINADGPNGYWDWGWNHQSQEVGSEGYVVFDLSGEYDIVYGAIFDVYANQAHGHQTVYVFWLPAPEVGVQKNTVGGSARPGGKYVYGVEYHNDGNGVATDTLIVDTLPLSTTYAGDTSGFPHIEANGVITWHLGNLPPPGNNDNWGIFAVTLDVSDTVPDGGSLSPNCATISTSAPGDSDPSNDTSCANPVDVSEDDVNIRVDKWPNVGDPAPGQEFDYTIQWCSTSGAGFGPVWLTDTLPLSTTLVSWSTDWPWNMWSEVITTGGQLALYAPGLPGSYCQNINLRLLLDPDASPGAVLQNTVVVTTPHDRDDFDNVDVDTDARVGGPRYDMRADKNVNSSVLVPGGWIDYHIGYWNQGNTAVHVWLTDTLPEGTTYQPGSAREQDGGPAFPPVTVADEIVVWDLGVIEVNEGFGLDFTVDVSDTVAADTTITNCAAVGVAGAEDTPWDNTACVAATINDHGPNLRVTKRSWWNGDNQLGYQIQFYNVGDQQVNDVWITDTLPVSTTWDGWWNMGFDWGRLISESLGSSVLMWQFSTLYPGDSGGIELNANLDDPNSRPRWYTNTVEIDAPAGDVTPDDNSAATVDVKAEVEQAEMWVADEGANMWGRAQPNVPVTVTTALAQYTGTVNEWGDWNIDRVEAIEPGATITVTAGAGVLPIVIAVPDPFIAYASSITDTVWGEIGGAANEELQVHGYWPAGYKEVPTDDVGAYVALYQDVPRGAQGHVRYETAITYATVVMHRRFQTPDLAMNVNYGHDWVNGNYEPGHTVWITLTESDRVTVKATAVLTTGPIPDWGGQSGFQTQGEDWTPNNPDIAPGDWVYGSLDGVYTSSVRVGTITGAVDVDADTVSGTITADWFTQTLNAQCGVWEPGGPGYNFTVAPDGGSYLCDFSGEWDLLPGQTVHVDYQEPDGDWVLNAFQSPVPHLRVQMGADGSPAEGGNFTFHVQYQNGGEADAEDVVITGTLQGATYLADTSGFSYTGGGGGPIVWELGTVAPGDWIRFDVFVQVTAVESETLANAVQIATSNPYDQGDPGEKYSDWSGHVEANNTYLNVGKSAWTNDPAPGYDLVFVVNPCNNGGTASSEVVLTDTLHPSLTLQYWWAQYAGWQEVSSDDHRLVVAHPSIPGGWCSEVYLRAYLDENAWQGMSISNTAVISASNDMEDNGNETTWWGSVGSPHTNLSLSSQMEWGRLVPGGEIAYSIQYNNNGNVPVDDVLITVTLPASTTFSRSWYWTSYGEPPVAPAVVTADYVVWDIGTLDNGYGQDMGVALAIDSHAPVGAVLTSTATISPRPHEDRYDDNSSTVVETLHEFGPNLRVSKYLQWENQGRIRYGIQIRNIGSTRMESIWITDTYPLSTTSDGNFWVGHGPWYTTTHDAPNRQFVVWAESLDSGETGHFGFWVDLDGALHGIEGLIFTNTVAAPWPDDVYPADNTDVELAYTGPDVYVEKRLNGGVPKPGAIVTFTVEFGNRNRWPWDGDSGYGSHITDTLPAEMAFVNATAPGDPSQSWMPNQLPGNVLVWDWGTMWNNSAWTFDVAVQITDTVEGGDVLTNVIAAYGDSPDDVEPFYDNNVFALPVTILNPRFEVGKVYESSRVAGMPITYTLTVTNVGNEIATGVILSDAIPSELENVGGGGTLELPWMWWSIESLAANGGVATEMFSATLPCRGAVVNDEYRVVSSDQGVSSAVGAPVRVDVLAPTLEASFAQSADAALVGATLYFTDTSTTNGPAIVAWAWDFGAVAVASGATVSYTFDAADAFTITLTITDACGYTDAATSTVAISSAETYIYLPLVLRNG